MQWALANGTSAEPYPAETDPADTLATLSKIFLGVVLSLMILISIVGNILVCVAIYTERSLRKIGNLFLASLAISDLFVSCLVMTFAVVNDLMGYWVFGEQFCDTWISFDVMCSTASILNLCAISLDRYIHIKDPLRYGRWINKKMIFGSIACIWLLAALISFLPISLDLHKDPESELESTENWASDTPSCVLELTPTYAVVSSCISFYLPCAVMVSIYCRLYMYARKHVQNIKAITRPLSLGTMDNSRHSSGASSANTTVMQHSNGGSAYHVSDHKAAITIGVIMGVFLICWVPFFCVNIVAAFCKVCIPEIWFKILTWLGYSNSAFNPIIYSIFNTEFRDAFKKILTSHYPVWCCGKCGYQAVATSRRSTPYDPEPETGSLRQINGSCVPSSPRSARSSAGSANKDRQSSCSTQHSLMVPQITCV